MCFYFRQSKDALLLENRQNGQTLIILYFGYQLRLLPDRR